MNWTHQTCSVIQSCPTLCALWTAACQASLLISQSLLKLIFIESVMQSPSHSLSSPSCPALNLSQHQGLFRLYRVNIDISLYFTVNWCISAHACSDLNIWLAFEGITSSVLVFFSSVFLFLPLDPYLCVVFLFWLKFISVSHCEDLLAVLSGFTDWTIIFHCHFWRVFLQQFF